MTSRNLAQNVKEIGVYTSWTSAGDSVIGFAKAKFKGFCTYSEAAVCMLSSGYSDFNVFDGENTYFKSIYGVDLQMEGEWMEDCRRGDVKNKDEWMELANLAEDSTTKITWKHVAAHSGIAGNEEADKLAVKVAKQNTAYFQRSEECSEVSSRSIIHLTVEKSAVTNSKPNDITPILIDTTHHDMKINMTPNRKTSRDNSNTPVLGSMNGSFVSTQPKQASLQTEKPNLNVGSSTGIREPTGNIQTIKIMTNMETILETITTEMHQLKEDQLEFKKEVKQQISSN